MAPPAIASKVTADSSRLGEMHELWKLGRKFSTYIWQELTRSSNIATVTGTSLANTTYLDNIYVTSACWTCMTCVMECYRSLRKLAECFSHCTTNTSIPQT